MALIGIIIIGMISALIFFWSRGSLWEDEIIAISHGLQPLPLFFVEVLRHDIHPFIYFLLLKGWVAFLPESDQWALASSLLAALFSTLVVAYVSYQHFGKRTAFWATAIFVILPNFAWAAGNLRMYALLPGLVLLMWHANIRFLLEGQRSWLLAGFLLEAILINTHIIEFFFVGFIALGALAISIQQAQKNYIKKWLFMQSLALILMFPILTSAIFRGSEQLPTPTISSLFLMPAQLISGWKLAYDPLAVSIGGVIFFSLLFVALRVKFPRITVLVVVCGALVTSMLVALFGKPLFKPPVFTANLVPFLVVSGAAGIATLKTNLAKSITMALIGSLAIATIPWSISLLPRESYRPAAEYIVAHAKSGDVVVVPNLSVHRGILRYAVGHDWGHPLDIMRLENKPAWARLIAKLGPEFASSIGLIPLQDYVEHNGIFYVISNNIKRDVPVTGNIWVVLKESYPETVHFLKYFHIIDVHWFNEELSVTRLSPAESGILSVSNPSQDE